MNKKDFIMLIEEWIKSPPGSRPFLDKAIAEQYQKSRESHWLGLRPDELLDWLREAMAGMAVDKDIESEIENRVAKLLTEEDGGTEACDQELPLAALRSTPEHGLRSRNMPSDEEIARKVRTLLERLDKEEGRFGNGR